MTLRVAFVSLWDASDPNAESGYGFSMRRQLMRRFDVVDIFPLDLPNARRWWPVRAVYKARGEYFHPMREPSVLEPLGRVICERLAAAQPDVLFAPSSLPLSYCETGIPWIFSTDQLFGDFLGSYIPRPAGRFRRAGELLERRALSRAAAATFPSEQAARLAVEHYGAEPKKISVLPWGGNLPSIPGRDDVAKAVAARSPTECRLVFIGRDWVRKGGKELVATVQELNCRGLRTRGAIIGCDPPNIPARDFDIFPFIDKREPGQFATLAKLLAEAHFFFLPSHAEAYGQAFCEAAAFGVPSIGSTVGGIPTIIRDRRTGYMLPPGSSATAYADLVQRALTDRDGYRDMALAARRDFEDRLNWDVFGDRLAALVEAAAGRGVS